MPTHPTINDARKLAKANNLRRCVVLFELDDGRVGYSSYGRDKRLCGSTQRIMDDVFCRLESEIVNDSMESGYQG